MDQFKSASGVWNRNVDMSKEMDQLKSASGVWKYKYWFIVRNRPI